MPNYYVSPLRVAVANGTTHADSTTEAIIVPNFTFAASDPRLYQGAAFRLTVGFSVSNVVTTPGTITLVIRKGGVSGTVLATTKAIQMDTSAHTSFSGWMEAIITVRSIGSSGSMFCQGFVLLNNTAAGAAADPQYYLMGSAGANVPAVVSSLDFTTAAWDLAVSADFSVATAGTNITSHTAILEAIGS
jgi:hypothetical protein